MIKDNFLVIIASNILEITDIFLIVLVYNKKHFDLSPGIRIHITNDFFQVQWSPIGLTDKSMFVFSFWRTRNIDKTHLRRIFFLML